MRPRGFVAANVRVIVGDTVEIWRRGGRLGVGLIGIDAPQGNTTCGIEAAAKLQRLVSGGARFLRERSIRFDERFRGRPPISSGSDAHHALRNVLVQYALLRLWPGIELAVCGVDGS